MDISLKCQGFKNEHNLYREKKYTVIIGWHIWQNLEKVQTKIKQLDLR